LSEDPSLVRHLVADIIPFLLCSVVNLTVFDNIVMIDKIAGFQVFAWVDGARITHRKWPVFHRPFERLPDADQPSVVIQTEAERCTTHLTH